MLKSSTAAPSLSTTIRSTSAGKRVTADKILIAVGGRPFVPGFDGSGHVITSDDAFFLPELPERIVIVGGGYIAVEFAGIFSGLGAQVTQLYRGERFLRGFDDDVRDFLADEMVKKGVDLRFNTDVRGVTRRSDGALSVELKDGGKVETDLVMYATGRVPNTGGLELDAAGVATGSSGAVRVDADWRTNVDNIYAIGDVTDRIQLTPWRSRKAMRWPTPCSIHPVKPSATNLFHRQFSASRKSVRWAIPKARRGPGSARSTFTAPVSNR